MQNIRTVDIKGKKYVDVAERVRLAHAERESFEIVESGLLSIGGTPIQIGDMWVWQVAILVNGKRYMGSAEVKLNAPKNTADGTNPFACAETSAVGRALGMAGLGALESICSADEVARALAEQEAPLPQSKPQQRDRFSSSLDGASQAQLDALRNLYKKLGKDAPDLSTLDGVQAAQAIRDLQSELKMLPQKSA